MSHFLILLLLLALFGTTTALGYVRPHKECAEPKTPVLYLSRWSKRDCIGIPLTGGTVTLNERVYGHTLYVPIGYNVIIVKEPLFGFPRETLYSEGTSRFVSYAFWDTPIMRVIVTKKVVSRKDEKIYGL